MFVVVAVVPWFGRQRFIPAPIYVDWCVTKQKTAILVHNTVVTYFEEERSLGRPGAPQNHTYFCLLGRSVGMYGHPRTAPSIHDRAFSSDHLAIISKPTNRIGINKKLNDAPQKNALNPPQAKKSFEDYLSYLPPLKLATTQVVVTNLLGSVIYTK